MGRVRAAIGLAFVAVFVNFLVSTTIQPSPTAAADGDTIRVPDDAPTLTDAIAATQPGDTILLSAGTYLGGYLVPPEKSGITIRGVDRNTVVFDGRGSARPNAIEIEADGVTVENLSIHDYDGNGVYWDEVVGFAGRYLTVWNVGLYGVYAIQSTGGVFEDSLVSGAADAAFYIGECNPCDTVMRRLIARYSAIGYSGTNAGGNLELRDSTWELNGTAIMPNSFDDQEAPAPQRSMLIAGNTIRDSGTVPVPANSPLAGFVGVGIAIAGGMDNLVEGNTIEGSAAYGIALFPTIQQDGSAYQPGGNRIRNNTVSGSGKADLGVAEGAASGNCFAGNTHDTSLPAALEDVMPCDGAATGEGDPVVTADLGVPIPVALERLGPRPNFNEMPAPDPQPSMPGPAPSASPEPGWSAGFIILVAIAAALAVGIVLVIERRRRTA